MRDSADGARLAIGTFTVLPVRAAAPTASTARVMMLLAPAVGAMLGAVAASVAALVTRLAPPGVAADLLAAALAVATLATLTRGLHLDGLADTVDGLGSMRGPEGAREVMRAGDVGPLGVLALLLAVVIQTGATAVAIGAGRAGVALVVATATGRLAATLACTPRTPAADAHGLGSTVAGSVGPAAASTATAATAAGAVALAGVDGGVAVVVAVTLARVVRRHAVRRLGGITGDVLGALVECAATGALLVLALTA